MTAVFPVFMGASASNIRSGNFLFPAVPITSQPGDTVIGFGAQTSGGTISYTPLSPYQIGVQFQSSPTTTFTQFSCWATQVALGVAAPSVNSPGGNTSVQTLIFRNCKQTNPVGASRTNSASSSSPSVPAMLSTADRSLAILFFSSSSLNPTSWPPSGWTQLTSGVPWLAYKQLTNKGDSTGSVSVGISGSDQWSLSIFELLGQPTIPGDYWSGGAPNPA